MRMNATPPLPVTLETTSQAHVYHTSVVGILADEYPADEKKQEKLWMSDETFAISTAHSKMCDKLCRTGRQLANAVVWFTF